MKDAGLKKMRFELRLSREDRDLFERASRLAGFSTLSSFVLSAIREYAGRIIKEKERILASERDREIFFEAILSDTAPNEALKKAAKRYFENRQEE